MLSTKKDLLKIWLITASGPIIAAILEKENAVNDFRELIGPQIRRGQRRNN